MTPALGQTLRDGARREPLNVRFAPKATNCCVTAKCRDGQKATSCQLPGGRLGTRRILNSNAIEDWELTTRAAQPPEQGAYVAADLLGSLPNDFSGAERNRSGQLQLVSSD